MNAMSSDVFPFRLHWDSQDLADAVPLRLFELCDFAVGGDADACANAGSMQRPARRGRGYLPAPAFAALFHVGD
jgi:hypothetical protein